MKNVSEQMGVRHWFTRGAVFLSQPLVGGPLILVSLGVSGLLGYWATRLDGIPNPGPPFDLNAVQNTQIDPADNSAADYQAAFSLLDIRSHPDFSDLEWSDIEAVESGDWQGRNTKIDDWIQDNERALERWREGTERDFCQFVPLQDLTIDSYRISSIDAQALCQLAGLKAIAAESSGDVEDAWLWHRARFRFSRHIAMFATPWGRYIATGLHGSTANSIVRWAGDDLTTSALLGQALTAVRSDFEMTPPRSVMIKAEYFVVLDQLNRLGETAEVYRQAAAWLRPYGTSITEFPSDFELFLNNERELTRRLLRHQVANLLKFIDEPDGHRPAKLGCRAAYFAQSSSAPDRFLEPSRFQCAVDRSALAQILLMRTGGYESYLTREEARQRLLEAVLAAELYRREYGAFPESLQALVAANLLSSVPIDPTSSNLDSVQYERHSSSHQRAKVWTVGLNRVDDGGNFETIDGQGQADMGYRIGAYRSDETDQPVLGQ